jgi:hypothetical protein
MNNIAKNEVTKHTQRQKGAGGARNTMETKRFRDQGWHAAVANTPSRRTGEKTKHEGHWGRKKRQVDA